MNKFGGKILFFMVLLTLTACSSDGEHTSKQETIQVMFNINMGSSSFKTTRATWGDNIDDNEKNNYDSELATYNENTINPDKFLVLLFSNDENRYLGRIENLDYTRGTDEENHIYEVWGTLNIDERELNDGKLKFKLVILANYDGNTDVVPMLSDLANEEYDYSNHLTSDVAAGKAYIPMYGVKTCTDVTISNNFSAELGTIYMLRAMAKVRVILDRDTNENGTIDEGEDFALSSVSITNYNTKGYLVPKGFDTEANTENLKRGGTSFNPHPDGNVEESLEFYQESDTVFYVYLPEYDIAMGRPEFSVKFDFQKTDDEKVYSFAFDEYDNNVAKNSETYDIERNTIYDFIIKKAAYSVIVTSGDWIHVFDNEINFE